MKGPINFGVFALVLSTDKTTFSIEGPPEPIIIPVVKLDDKKIGTGVPGELTKKLRAEYKKLTETEGTEY